MRILSAMKIDRRRVLFAGRGIIIRLQTLTKQIFSLLLRTGVSSALYQCKIAYISFAQSSEMGYWTIGALLH